jgi:hypothetical protein
VDFVASVVPRGAGKNCAHLQFKPKPDLSIVVTYNYNKYKQTAAMQQQRAACPIE